MPRVRKLKERFLAERRTHQEESEHRGANGCFFCDAEEALKAEGWQASDLLDAIVGD